MHRVPHRIQDKVYPLATRKFCSWNKIRVTAYQDDLIHLALETEGRNVEADAHIDAFLRREILKVLVFQVFKFQDATQEHLETPIFQPPFTLIHEMPEAKSHLSEPPHFVVQSETENRLRSLGKLY
jgi:hypothetical protein